MNCKLYSFDREIIKNNQSIIGIDEAGRGPLAGPVMASAIRLDADFYKTAGKLSWIGDVDDSKKLAPRKREYIFNQMIEAKNNSLLSFSVASASVEEIEKLNILWATALAMHSAIETMNKIGSLIIIDGNPIKALQFNHVGIIKGDSKSLAIAMASIAAKVTRDKHMDTLDNLYPVYGFAKHKGYGTKQHIAAIKAHGITPEHRSLFIRKILHCDMLNK